MAKKKRVVKKRVVKRKPKKVVKRKSRKLLQKRSKRLIKVKQRPLSNGFLAVGILGLLLAVWWTYFGFEGKLLSLEWGITLIIFFIIMIIASFRSLEIS